MNQSTARPSGQRDPRDDSWWEERPTGGALLLTSNPFVANAGIALELVVGEGPPHWFWHVMDVPFEVAAAQA